MPKRLLQAAIITFLLQLLALVSSPTDRQASTAYRWRSNQTPIAVLVHRLFQSQKTLFR